MNPIAHTATVAALAALAALGGCAGPGDVEQPWTGPRIAVDVSAPARAAVGQPFRYDIVVSNPSPLPAEGVVLTATLPDGVACVTATPAAKASGRTLSWRLGPLPARARLSFAVQAVADRPGDCATRVRVAAAEGLSAADGATTACTRAGLSAELTAPAEAPAGKPIPYRVVVRNTGQTPATGVKLVGKLPAGLTWRGQSTVTAAIGTLAPGETRRIDFQATPARPGAYAGTVVVTGDGAGAARATADTVVR